jgi:thiol:disulfide interchange protein
MTETAVGVFVGLIGRLIAAMWLVLGLNACAASPPDNNPRPYDEKSDARAAIAAAMADNPGRKRILLTFGANWCSDSRALEAHYRSPTLAPVLADAFTVVHIDVGMFHRNLDLVEEYGNPIDKGIPSVVLLDADGKALFVNHGGLSSAGYMKAAAVQRYFERLAKDGRVD